MKLRILLGVALIAVLVAWLVFQSQATRPQPGRSASSSGGHAAPAAAVEVPEPLSNRETVIDASGAEGAAPAPQPRGESWSIVGTVSDEQERPIPGALVVPDSRTRVQLSTDAQGKFRFEAPDPRPFKYLKSFAVTHPDFIARRAPVELGDAFYVERTQSMHIVLQRGLTVSVLVIDEERLPVEGAYVRVRGVDDDSGVLRPNPWLSLHDWQWAESRLVSKGLQCLSALTDVSGFSKLQVAKPAEYMLVAWKSGYVSEPDRPWGIVGAGDTKTYVLTRGMAISGIVLDSTELAVPGASIVCETTTRSDGRFRRLRAGATTDELGKFAIAGLGVDPVRTTLTAQHATRGSVNMRVADPSEPQTVHLVPHLEVHIRLLDCETGAPIEGTARLDWGRSPRDDGVALTVSREHELTVANGELSATIPRFIETATLTLAGYDAVELDLRPYVDLPSLDRTLELQKGLRYEVRIVDGRTGNPLRGATLRLACGWLDEGGRPNSSSSMVPAEWREGAEVFVLEGVQLRRSTAISLLAMHEQCMNKSVQYKSPESGALLGDVVIAMERQP